MGKTISTLIEELKAGVHDSRLKELYVDEALVPSQRERYIAALKEFEKLYGEKEVEIYSASGRSEIGGNHTDHQFGKVMATSVNIDTLAVVAPRTDSIVKMKSEGYPALTVDIANLEVVKKEEGTTAGLIRGVAAGIKNRGYEIGGFEGYATSQVLSGSGLSSSAAYEVLIGNIISGIYNDCKLDSVLIAKIGQYAENVYFGKPCGLMDQMACSVGGLIHIDFENPEEPIVEKVNVDFENFHHSLCIVDTKGSHADLTDEYAAIPEEMKKVAAFFGKSVLREVKESEFNRNIPAVRRACGDRATLRAFHLFDENRRVDEQYEALNKGDFNEFKRLVKESGNSSYKFLQNVYSSRKTGEQSVSIGLVVSEEILGDHGVARVHGGGFAGTIQAFVPDDLVDAYKTGMENVFGKGACYVLKVRPIGGCKVM